MGKRIIAVAPGGSIEHPGDELPPRARVRFEAVAKVDSIKRKFLEDGTEQEVTTLVIDVDSFVVQYVSTPPEQLELAEDDLTDEERAALDAAVEAPADLSVAPAED